MRSRNFTVKYVVIGGAGAMGSIVVRDLFETAGATSTILIADYNGRAARRMAESYRSSRVKSCSIDVRERNSARRLTGANVVINCAHYSLNLDVMKLALAAGSHYVDLGGLFHMTRRQLKLNGRFRRAGLSAVIGMGAAPGIANLLAKRGADGLDRINEIHIRVGSVDRTRYLSAPALCSSYSIKTILEEFSLKPAVFTRGRFIFVPPMSGRNPHRFPLPVGVQTPMYTLHSEVATLPLSFARKGVREVSFKIAFDQKFVERVQFLRDVGLASGDAIRIKGSRVVPLDVVDRVIMSQSKPVPSGKLRQHEVVRAVIKGTLNGKKITRVMDCHTAGMPAWDIGLDIDTGSPPSVVAQMLATHVILERGVLPPETCVPQAQFFRDLGRRRMVLRERTQSNWKFKI